MNRWASLLLVACSTGPVPDGGTSFALSPTQSVVTPSKVDPITKGVPHGGQISRIAVTEQGDAALTFDSVGGVRLWPALDGSRTPIPVAAIAPRKLGLAHAGRDLFATILDQAGNVRLVRLGLDGSVRGDVHLPAEVAYEQAIALDDGALVRSEDHAIEWFSPDGESRGRLIADPSTRIDALAARRGRVAAIVSTGGKHELRWLHRMAGTLTWGASVALPGVVKGELVALSPSHRRVAVVDSASRLSVYELGLVPTKIGESVLTSNATSIGFIDEDRVALMASSLQWWVKPHTEPATDPWAVASAAMPQPSPTQLVEGGAVADHLAVSSFGAALALTDRDGVHYLGYREHGAGTIGVATDSLWVSMNGSSIVWLDDALAVKRAVELRKSPSDPWIYAIPIGEHHIVRQVPVEREYRLELVDVDHPEAPVTIGVYRNLERLDFSADANVLAISTSNKLHRVRLDLAANTATELPALRSRGSLITLRMLDPARADGITALTVGWEHDDDAHYTLTMHREEGAPTKIRSFTGRVIDIDATGNIYVVDGNEVQVRRGDKKVASFEVEGIGSAVAVNGDGSRYAMLTRNEVVVLDGRGAELWRKPVWGTAQLVFMKDGKRLAVRASGGLVMFDAATGAREALECGWSYALMTTPPSTNAIASASVCEDPTL